jgi:hypothetical protein
MTVGFTLYNSLVDVIFFSFDKVLSAAVDQYRWPVAVVN